jgi:hypothetical protein
MGMGKWHLEGLHRMKEQTFNLIVFLILAVMLIWICRRNIREINKEAAHENDIQITDDSRSDPGR